MVQKNPNPNVESDRPPLPVQRELQSDGCSGHDLFTSNQLSMQLIKTAMLNSER